MLRIVPPSLLRLTTSCPVQLWIVGSTVSMSCVVMPTWGVVRNRGGAEEPPGEPAVDELRRARHGCRQGATTPAGLTRVTVRLPEYLVRAMELSAAADETTIDDWLHHELTDFAGTVVEHMERIVPGFRQAYLYPGKAASAKSTRDSATIAHQRLDEAR